MLGSVLQRFLWVINVLARNGFVVVIVNQLELDPTLMENRSVWAQARPYCLTTQ